MDYGVYFAGISGRCLDNLADSTVTFNFPTDTNLNGIVDTWEQQYFGNLNKSATGDFDGDGVNNITEYLQGRNPTKGAVADTSGAVNLVVFTPLD